jgi:hypothetical protein
MSTATSCLTFSCSGSKEKKQQKKNTPTTLHLAGTLGIDFIDIES